MKKHGGWKIAGIACAALVLFLSVVNIVPPRKNEEPNPFIVEEGEMPMIAAHRGGALTNPENTMLAFKEAAYTYKVDIVDSDLYTTKDGFLVYSYNSYIDENCNVNGDMTLEEVKELCEDEDNRHYIKDMTLEELKLYNFGYYFTDEKGEYIYKNVTDPEEIEEQGLQIVTVDQLFDELYEEHPDLMFVLEIKDDDEAGIAACDALYEVLSEYPEYQDRVVVGTFHNEVAEKLKEDYPELLRGASTGSAFEFIATHYLGINLFADGDFACLQIPSAYGEKIEIQLADKSIVDKAHERNIAVQCWTVNDEEEMRKLIEMGVDCIMTDDPALLAKVIEEYRQQRIDGSALDNEGTAEAEKRT
jgi:glycerophosphoryl diester phosphodiesterase